MRPPSALEAIAPTLSREPRTTTPPIPPSGSAPFAAAPLEVTLRKEGDDYVGEVYGAIANTIAYISEAIDPISIFIGLSRRDLMAQAVRYLLFGEGETGLMVYTILLRYWDWTPEEDVRPLIFLMSD
jgi:hypothetical protein